MPHAHANRVCMQTLSAAVHFASRFPQFYFVLWVIMLRFSQLYFVLWVFYAAFFTVLFYVVGSYAAFFTVLLCVVCCYAAFFTVLLCVVGFYAAHSPFGVLQRLMPFVGVYAFPSCTIGIIATGVGVASGKGG